MKCFKPLVSECFILNNNYEFNNYHLKSNYNSEIRLNQHYITVGCIFGVNIRNIFRYNLLFIGDIKKETIYINEKTF